MRADKNYNIHECFEDSYKEWRFEPPTKRVERVELLKPLALHKLFTHSPSNQTKSDQN